MTDRTAAAQNDRLAQEIAHWRFACDALADLDAVASPAAWASLEEYLRMRVRDRLAAAVAELSREAASVAGGLARGDAPADVRRRLLRLRRHYLQVETVLDFYGDAVASRTNPTLAAILRGLDVIAADSLERMLRPLGIPAPIAMVYLDKGLGAAILRADVRLWDRTSVSPVAAIKLTRHNLWCPTALLHETGHQFAHLTGWTGELADCLAQVLAPRSAELASAWRGWASEVAADVHAFAQAGWAPLAPLANVVDGTTSAVYRLIPSDPHPFPWIRVMFNAALCRSWFGAGPWDGLAAAWAHRHPPANAPADVGAPGPTQRRGLRRHRRHLHAKAHASVRRAAAARTRRPIARFADGPRCPCPPGRPGAAHVAVPGPARLARHPGVAVDASDDRSEKRHRPPQDAAGLVGHAVRRAQRSGWPDQDPRERNSHMLENTPTRRAKKPAVAAKKAEPKVVIETAPVGGNGEVSPSQAAQAAALVDSIPDLVKILAENIRHNTELLAQIDQRRAATQTGDRPAGVEQLRTILDYKSIGQMAGRSGDPFQDNLIGAARARFIENNMPTDKLALFDLPAGAAKVSVQVDGVENAEVLNVVPGDVVVTLNATAGRDIGRIEVLNSDLEPIRLGPRMVAPPLTNNPSFE